MSSYRGYNAPGSNMGSNFDALICNYSSTMETIWDSSVPITQKTPMNPRSIVHSNVNSRCEARVKDRADVGESGSV